MTNLYNISIFILNWQEERVMIKNNFGEMIEKIRKFKGMTRNSLADGICSPTYIYNIERGDNYPTAYVLEGISRKFDIDVIELYRISQYENPFEMFELKRKITKCYDEGDMKQFAILIKDLSNFENLLTDSDKQFLYWCNGIVEIAINSDNEKALSYYIKSILITKSSYDFETVFSSSLSSQEINIMNSILVVKMKNNDYPSALIGYELLTENISRFSFNFKKRLYIDILYNLAYLYELDGKLESSKATSYKAIEVSKEIGDLSNLFNLYYLLGTIEYQLGNTSLAFKCFDYYITLASITLEDREKVTYYIKTIERLYNYKRPRTH